MAIAQLTTDVLVVGGGTGGAAAAIQAARCGVNTILVSEFSWLGGMLTSAGVAAPDGNELIAWQTGLWGTYLQALKQRQPEGLDHAWVSLFTYHPRTGADIFADWVRALPHLTWIEGQAPLEVLRSGDRITGVRFADYQIEAQITVDGTELGDLLALGEIPHRWGWELQSELDEPSAPIACNELTTRYPVQSPTWVFILQDWGASAAPRISPAFDYNTDIFNRAWRDYGADKFLNYGRLPGNLFTINWPIWGNDYGEGVGRLVESESARQLFLQEAYQHSQNFAHFIQSELGLRYGLAPDVFPHRQDSATGLQNSFALHPYYRESRRLQGQTTIAERDILPIGGGAVAALPLTKSGEVSSIAIGNYANDHHYPGVEFSLHPKSIRWGGRWTGTPFAIPYGSLVPVSTDGLLVCEKNISVSHIANGSTRLQPVVMNIGQAAGMAAALCVQLNYQPRELPIGKLQEALLTDADAPSAVIPLFNLPPDHPDWLKWQRYYLNRPQDYPIDGHCPCTEVINGICDDPCFTGIFHDRNDRDYRMTLTEPIARAGQTWQLITLRPDVDRQLQTCIDGQQITLWGRCNASGEWLVVQKIADPL